MAARRLPCWMILALWLFGASAVVAQDKIGVILLHGKWGRPDTTLATLAGRLADKSWLVAQPEMPWSGRRLYDAPYDRALEEITAAAAGLRQKGATKIIVIGQSLGANAALAYAAYGPNVNGVVAISPGHTVDLAGGRSPLTADVDKARRMIAEGQGDERAWFADVNQGRTRQVQTTARIYLTYFDPQGKGAMPKSAAAIPAPMPLLWIVGRQDAMAAHGESYAYARAPADPRSRYVVIDADHFNAATVAADQVVSWIAGL